MEEQDLRRFPLKLAYAFLQSNGLATECTAIRESKEKLGSYDWTLKRAMALGELRRNQLIDRFIAERWRNGITPEGQKELKRLDKIYGRYQQSIGDPTPGTATEEDESHQGTAFAYEHHLRDY